MTDNQRRIFDMVEKAFSVKCLSYQLCDDATLMILKDDILKVIREFVPKWDGYREVQSVPLYARLGEKYKIIGACAECGSGDLLINVGVATHCSNVEFVNGSPSPTGKCQNALMAG